MLQNYVLSNYFGILASEKKTIKNMIVLATNETERYNNFPEKCDQMLELKVAQMFTKVAETFPQQFLL